MNEKLIEDVYKLLGNLEGMCFHDAKILLETALKVLETSSYLELNPNELKYLKEELKNGKY